MMTSEARVAIRPRITKVGSAYRREVNSGTCELCFAEWTATIRDVSFRLDAADGDPSWEATVSTFHEGSWNDNWEVEVDPFVLSAALARVMLAVDQALLDNPEGPAFIAREILEAAAHLDRVADIIERLDGRRVRYDDFRERVADENDDLSADADEEDIGREDARGWAGASGFSGCESVSRPGARYR